jgi:hypothetical protein
LPELWLRIFAYATWIPGALEISDHQAISAFFRDTYGITTHKRFEEALQLKLSAALVCKQWYRLITQALFEYIIIRSDKQILKVATVLENKTLWNGDHGPGWWTIRLELALQGSHLWTIKDCRALSRIFNHCPNLKIISTAFCSLHMSYSSYTSFISALTVNQLQIRRLEIKGEISTINAIISKYCASLEVLCLPDTTYGRMAAPTLVDLQLPKLHMFSCSSSLPSIFSAKSTIPSLKWLLVNNNIGLDIFLEVYGTRLHHLSLPAGVTRSLSSILCACPSIQSLSIGFVHILLPSFTKLVPQPHIHVIYFEYSRGLQAAPYFNIRSNILADSLAVLVSLDIFPSLECIRFFLPCAGFEASYVPPLFLDIWVSWLFQCSTRGISVQASQGADLQTANVWAPFNPLDLL